MKNSPWGQVDQEVVYARGLTQVSTPGHGGLMVALGYAMKHLTPNTRKRGMRYGDYLCYEEDCDYALVEIELLPQLHDRFFEHSEYDTFKKRLDYLIYTLSVYHADYLLEREIEPDPNGYKIYLNRQECNRVYEASKNDPAVAADLIVSATGEQHRECQPGETRVVTADGSVHFVRSDSYKYISGPNLLSRCVLSR